MLKHICIDPQDPYAQDEVVVAFERTASAFRIVSAINADGDNILDDLIEVQRSDLLRELAEADRDAFLSYPSAQDQGGLQMVLR